MKRRFDIVIVGGGIAGASLGAAIAAGRSVLIVEREEVCGYHSTGRSAAFYLESYGGPDVALLTLASQAFLDTPPPPFAQRGFLHRRGALHLGRGEWPEVPAGVVARRLDRAAIDAMVEGVRPAWDRGLFEPGCADIDVAALHAAYLAAFRRSGGEIATSREMTGATRTAEGWVVDLGSDEAVDAAILVNAAGAWGDRIAALAGVRPIGLAPKRRTMVQVEVDRSGLHDLPLIDDWRGSFYFKGAGDRTVWLSPHDEIATEPCDAAPEEIDIAVAIDRFERAVDWPVKRVERSWAGLRTFSPDRLPVYGFDSREPAFFWCVGQGGFGIQTSPAAALLASSLIDKAAPDRSIARIDPTLFSPERFG